MRIRVGQYYLSRIMELIGKILNHFNGLHFRQEYLCLADPLESSLHVIESVAGSPDRDVTHSHLFIGYHPLVIALPYRSEYGAHAEAQLLFVPDKTPIEGSAEK